MRNARRYWYLKIEKDGNDSLSIKHKEEIHKSTDLLTRSIQHDARREVGIAFKVLTGKSTGRPRQREIDL